MRAAGDTASVTKNRLTAHCQPEKARSGGLFGFDLQRNVDDVSYQETPRFERRVPLQAEVLAIDLRGRFEVDALAALRIFGLAAEYSVEHHLALDAPNGEVPVHFVLLPAGA